MNFSKIFFGVFFSLGLSFMQGQKVGVVDTDYILTKIPEYIEAEKRMDAQMAEWTNGINQLQKEYDAKKDALENERVLLIGEQLKQREKELDDLYKKLQKETKDKFSAEGELNKYRVNMIKPFQDQIWNAVKTVVDRNNLGMVLDKSNNISVIFLDKKFDYTDKVLDVLIKADKQKIKEREKEQKQREKEEREAQRKSNVPVTNNTPKSEAVNPEKTQEAKAQAEEEERIKKEQNRRLRELIDQEKGIKPKTTPEPTKTTPVTSTAQKEVVNSVPEKTPEQIKKEQDAAKKREIQRKVQELINKEKGIQPKIK